MVYEGLIDPPLLKSLALQFLLRHAENPALAASSRDESAAIRKFAALDPFYDSFIDLVKEKVGYDKKRLEDTGSQITHQNYLDIQCCFEELSNLRNPWDYQYLGRIIPSVGGGLAHLVSLAGPEGVIKGSPRWNKDLNNDQEIVVERCEVINKMVEAVIQHVFLPSTTRHYLHKVTAALGYYQMIDDVWNIPELGETQILDVQIPLEELLSPAGDLGHFGINFQEQNGEIILNGSVAGRRIDLTDNPEEVLGYSPPEQFLIKPAAEFKPIEIISDFSVNGELVLPAGRYGMPCNRYELSIPYVGLGKRAKYFFLGLPRLFSKESKIWRSKTQTISDTLYAAQSAGERELIHRAEAAEARAETAEKGKEALEYKTGLDKQLSKGNDIYEATHHLAHDGSHKGQDSLQNHREWFWEMMELHPGILQAFPKATYYGKEKEVIDSLQEKELPEELAITFARYGVGQGIDQNISQLFDDIKKGGRTIDTREIELSSVIESAVQMIQPYDSQVEVSCQLPPESYLVHADPTVLRDVFTNFLRNAVQHSPNGWVKVVQQENNGYPTRNWICQTGEILETTAQRLEMGEVFSEKLPGVKGSGDGFQPSRKNIEAMGGSVAVYSKEMIPLLTYLPKLPGIGGVVEVMI
tara:strand:+ start:235 stop:2151 length:1917 start_codon:yes stop_codon:yes gene_type:complete